MAQQRPGTSPGAARRGSIGATVGGRYRLDRPLVPDLPGAEPWSATDTILDRPVRVDLVWGPRTTAALDAARRAALVTEPRLARILQVAQDGELGIIVSNQVDGRSLADLAAAGPVAPDQARAIVGEVAAALEEARRRGLHHLALRPGSVIVTPAGRVTVRGLAVDGALIGLADTRAHAASRRDAIDLIRLLYSALTGRWPAPPTSTGAVPTFAEWSSPDAVTPRTEPETGLPDAPTTGTGSTPPAELVAQVPADLDTLCAVTLGPHEDGPHSPGEVVRELEPWRAVHADDLFRAADAGRWPAVGSATTATATATGSSGFAPVTQAAGMGDLSGAAGALAAGAGDVAGAVAAGAIGATAAAPDGGVTAAGSTPAAVGTPAPDTSVPDSPAAGTSAPRTADATATTRPAQGAPESRPDAPASTDDDAHDDARVPAPGSGTPGTTRDDASPPHVSEAGIGTEDGDGTATGTGTSDHGAPVAGSATAETAETPASAASDSSGLDWILPAPSDGSSATPGTASPTPIWPTLRAGDEPFAAAIAAAESTRSDAAPTTAPESVPAPVSAPTSAATLDSAPTPGSTPPATSASASTSTSTSTSGAVPPPADATADADSPGDDDPAPAPSPAAPPAPSEPGPPTAETPTPASAPPTGSSTMTDQQKPTPDDGTDAESTTPAQGTSAAPSGSPARQSIRTAFGSGEGAGARRPGTPPPAIPPRTPGRQTTSAAGAATGAAATPAAAGNGTPGSTASAAATGSTAGRPTTAPAPSTSNANDATGTGMPATTSAFPATTSGTSSSGGGTGSGGGTPDWGLPFDPESRQPRQPRHQFDPTRWVLGLVGVGIVVALVIAIGNVTRPWGEGGGSNDAAATPSAQATTAPAEAPAAPAEEPAPAAPAVVPTIAGVTTIDPSDADGEKEELIPRIWDGDPNTAWYTHTYNRPDFAGFKNAVGIAITLAEPATVTSVTLEVNGSGGNVEVRATDAANPTAGDVLTAGPLNGHTVLTLSQPTETQSLVLWFTSLAQTPDGKNRIEISELSVQ